MKVAIDIVLLPSEEMLNYAIDINKELLKTNENKIILNPNSCIPHISLCMGVIDEKDLPKIKEILKNISVVTDILTLKAQSLKADKIPTGKIVSGISIENTNELLNLHEEIMNKLWNYLTYDVSINMLYNPPEVEEVTTYWIESYAKKYKTPEKFEPHITVGFGQTERNNFPFSFNAKRLALCQLGNYCTCRKIINENILGEKK